MARGQKRHWQLLQNVPEEPPEKPVSIGPGIRYTPACTFAVYIYRDRKSIYVGCFDDIEDAVCARDKAAGAPVAAVPKRDGKVTINAFFDETFEPIATADLKPSAARSMRSRFNAHVRGTLGEKYLAEVDEARVAWFMASLLRKAVSKQTKRETISLIKAVFEAAVMHRMIPRNPAAQVKLPSRDPQRVVPPPYDVARAIIAAIMDPVARMAAEVMLFTGVRVGECLALTWEDVDLESGMIKVDKAIDQATGIVQTTKTKHGVRDIPIPSALAISLRAYRADQIAGDVPAVATWLFPDARRSADDPKRPPVMWYGDLTKLHWNPARAKAATRAITLHSLRHLYASKLIAARTDLMTVSRLLGHYSASFTLAQYGHCLLDDSAVAAQVDHAFA